MSGPGGLRVRDDAGGIWITTGWVVGVLVWVGIVTMYVAGFTPVAPLVFVPPVLLLFIAAGNLISPRRGAKAREELDPVPLDLSPSAGRPPESGPTDPADAGAP